MHTNYKKRNAFVEFLSNNSFAIIIGGIVISLVGCYVIKDYLPVHNAKAFFNKLDKRPGFEKMADSREYSKTKDSIWQIAELNQAIINGMDIASGYTPSQYFGSIKANDNVKLVDSDYKVIANGTYEAYCSNGASAYHIINVYDPKGHYDREFKIDSDKIIIRKENE